jgi:hypothetical protein
MEQDMESRDYATKEVVSSSARPTDSAVNRQDEGVTISCEFKNAESGAADMDCPSQSTGMIMQSYVYALGRIEARFPTIGVEKEYAQATGKAETAGLTDRQTLYAVLSQPQNHYLLYQLCWVFSIEGLETYILTPGRHGDVNLLLEALQPVSGLTDIDVVIGVRGPIASPEACNGLMVPVVVFDHIYSFDMDSLIKSIPKPDKISMKQFGAIAEELFLRIMQIADNAGATDEHRAINYLALRYPAVYEVATSAYQRDFALTSVDVEPSRLSGARKIMRVIFSFTNRKTDVDEKYFVRVDVTEKFPFLVTKMSPYYDR